ncbi:MAG: lactate utilization protein [Oscillospiraceae bacterium]|nr:lactate utilization protein [Oscillospiraceae bacterium]
MDIDNVIKSLECKGYRVSYFENADEAVRYLNREIDSTTVGFGDSATLLDIKLFESLSSHNNVYDPQHCIHGECFIETAKKALTSNVFLTSVNAVSETGEIVNIDGTGNRIAGSLFGHERVYFIVGINKLSTSLDNAVWRARNIAAPKNAKRLKLNTPCAKNAERCFDCSSPDRICNGMMIHFRKMNDSDMEIVLINESLGF